MYGSASPCQCSPLNDMLPPPFQRRAKPGLSSEQAVTGMVLVCIFFLVTVGTFFGTLAQSSRFCGRESLTPLLPDEKDGDDAVDMEGGTANHNHRGQGQRGPHHRG